MDPADPRVAAGHAARALRLARASPSFPCELAQVPAPPEEVWVRGRLELLAPAARIAVVGTRAPTPYGELQAERFGAALARAGCVVVSGLARGVDACAHRAALDAHGATIAVLGSGVDRPWPGGALTERMAREGLLLSELPPGTAPRRHHFPLRNRLLAGLARAVVVIEAAHASGSLITARWAVDLGRAVFALPGRVDQPMARGCHRLLREGAQLVESPEELLAELGLAPGAPEAAAPDHALLRALEGETLRPEELARRTRAELPAVLCALVELELAGWVARAPGGGWRRAPRASGRGPPEGGPGAGEGGRGAGALGFDGRAR